MHSAQLRLIWEAWDWDIVFAQHAGSAPLILNVVALWRVANQAVQATVELEQSRVYSDWIPHFASCAEQRKVRREYVAAPGAVSRPHKLEGCPHHCLSDGKVVPGIVLRDREPS